MVFDPDAFLAKTGNTQKSGFDPDAFLSKHSVGSENAPIPEEESGGFISGALENLSSLGKTIDSYTGAPSRAAIGALQDGKNPLSAFSDQFGEDPASAPTGRLIAEKAGISSDALPEIPKPVETILSGFPGVGGLAMGYNKAIAGRPQSDVAGDVIDLGADWTNLVTAGTSKLAAKGLGKAGELALKGTGKAADAATAGKASEVAGKVVNKVGDVQDALARTFLPKQAEDFQELLTIAQKNEIDPSLLPESVEFGPNSFLSRASRNLAEGVMGQPKLENFEKGLDAVRGAYEGKVSNIAGGAPLDQVAAGGRLREAYDKGVDNFFSKIDWTHNAVVENAPGLMLSEKGAQGLNSKLNGVEKYAKGLIARGVTNTQKEQGRQLIAAVEAIRNSNGSYKQIVEAQRMIGDAAFKSKNSLADIPPDVEKLRDIYFQIDDALIDTVKQGLGDDIAESLVENNKAMSEFFGQKGVLAPFVGSKNLSNEAVFKNLVLNGDSRRIEALRKVLPPEDFQALKGAFLESLIARNPDGSFGFKGLQAALRGRQNQLRTLFTPGELGDLQEIIKLGERFGNPVLSSSGTGASNIFRDAYTGVRDGIVSDAVIENMKARARGKVPAPPPQALLPNEALTDVVQEATKPIKSASGAILPGLEQARILTKSAQKSSTQESNKEPSDDLVGRMDANPEMLENISNPMLKRSLIMEINKRRAERGEEKLMKDLGVSEDPQKSFIEGN